MKGGSISVVCKGYITKVVWRAILALSGAWGPRELVISDTKLGQAGERVLIGEKVPIGTQGMLNFPTLAQARRIHEATKEQPPLLL